MLYVFMPPVRTLEDYLDLLAAVEATAESMRQPVLLEGYEPPPRSAVELISRSLRTPGDRSEHPPVASWDELVERTTFLYEAARESRLATEKFMLDGRHTGTGGGNHFVLGGATPDGLPLPAPAGSAAQPVKLLAQSPFAFLSVLGSFHRPDVASPAHR